MSKSRKWRGPKGPRFLFQLHSEVKAKLSRIAGRGGPRFLFPLRMGVRKCNVTSLRYAFA
jgi:hypothetical protein